MIREKLIRIMEFDKAIEEADAKIKFAVSQKNDIEREKNQEVWKLAEIIRPLRQNIFFDKDEKFYSAFVDKFGMLQIRPIVTPEEAENKLMMDKLGQER